VLNNKPRIIQFLRFCMVGLGNTTIDFTVFFLLNRVGVLYLLAQVLSYSAGVVNSFVLNRKWTFRMARKTNFAEVAKFIIVNGLSLLLSSSMLYILHDANHMNLWLAKIAATAVGIAVNYIGSYVWVFAENKPLAGDKILLERIR
jgi:putative flippase GtrA